MQCQGRIRAGQGACRQVLGRSPSQGHRQVSRSGSKGGAGAGERWSGEGPGGVREGQAGCSGLAIDLWGRF